MLVRLIISLLISSSSETCPNNFCLYSFLKLKDFKQSYLSIKKVNVIVNLKYLEHKCMCFILTTGRLTEKIFCHAEALSLYDIVTKNTPMQREILPAKCSAFTMWTCDGVARVWGRVTALHAIYIFTVQVYNVQPQVFLNSHFSKQTSNY